MFANYPTLILKGLHYFIPVLVLAALLAMTSFVIAGDDILEIQRKLLQEGIDPGPIDGILGPKTRAGIRQFQSREGLPVNGRLDESTLSELGFRVTETTLPAQLRIDVRLDDYLDSAETRTGEQFWMTVVEPVVIEEDTLIPVGARIQGTVTEAESAGRPQRKGRLVLEPRSLEVKGESISIDGKITAEGREVEGEGSLEEDLEKIGIGAGIGAVIGGLIEGGEGALAGLLIGGGGTFLATKGGQVELPPETPLIVELQEPVIVPVWE